MSAVVACGASHYLCLEGDARALRDLVTRLERGLTIENVSSEAVSPDSERPGTIEPVFRVGVQSTNGPVAVEFAEGVALLVGGRRELAELFRQMYAMIDRGPDHYEILRVFVPGYEHIDPATHIDLVVCADQADRIR